MTHSIFDRIVKCCRELKVLVVVINILVQEGYRRAGCAVTLFFCHSHHSPRNKDWHGMLTRPGDAKLLSPQISNPPSKRVGVHHTQFSKPIRTDLDFSLDCERAIVEVSPAQKVNRHLTYSSPTLLQPSFPLRGSFLPRY